MRGLERIAKEVVGERDSVLRSALVIVYGSSWGLEFPPALVIPHYIPLDEYFDLDLYNRNANLHKFGPAGPRL